MMDSNYLIQRKINAKRRHRRKVTLTIAFGAILLVLILVGLIKVIADNRKEENGTGNKSQTTGQKNPGKGKDNEVSVTPTPTPSPTPTVTPTPTPTPIPVTKIAVDAGHGGWDVGTNIDGFYEKDVTLPIALFLREYLEDAGYEVYMLRESDEGIELEKRPGMAAEQNVDLFVSVHINSFTAENVHGLEAYYYDKRLDGSDMLAQYVADEATKLSGAKNRNSKPGNYLVLRESQVPACLVECGYITSPTEREKLFSEEYQRLLAEGIANGIMKFMPAVPEVEEPQPEGAGETNTSGSGTEANAPGE